jgi:hypothetical protein
MFNIFKMAKNKYTSPKDAKRGCLCDDSTYSSECCKGELINQGIGSTVSQSTCVVKDENGNIISSRNN